MGKLVTWCSCLLPFPFTSAGAAGTGLHARICFPSPGAPSFLGVLLWMENILPVKMLGGLRPPRTPHYGPPAPDGKFDP